MVLVCGFPRRHFSIPVHCCGTWLDLVRAVTRKWPAARVHFRFLDPPFSAPNPSYFHLRYPPQAAPPVWAHVCITRGCSRGWKRLRASPEWCILSLFLVGTQTCVQLYKREARGFFSTERPPTSDRQQRICHGDQGNSPLHSASCVIRAGHIARMAK
jgi:hypothetical protein